MKRRSPAEIAYCRKRLQRLDVLCLPALRSLGHFELHGLTLLKASETASLDRREVHKNVFAILAADKAIAFGVVEPLYCPLFCHVDTGIPFNRFTLERFGGSTGRSLAVKARSCSRPTRSNVRSHNNASKIRLAS